MLSSRHQAIRLVKLNCIVGSLPPALPYPIQGGALLPLADIRHTNIHKPTNCTVTDHKIVTSYLHSFQIVVWEKEFILYEYIIYLITDSSFLMECIRHKANW